MAHTYFTAEQEAWLRDHYHAAHTYAELTEQFNAAFGTNRNRGMIADKCTKRMGLRGKINSGKYGNKAKEQAPIGTLRKSQTATYIKVRMVERGKHISGYAFPYWMPLQRKIWEDANGEIPDGYMVVFLDTDTENFDINNLYPINRPIAAHMAVNGWWSCDPEQTMTAIRWCEHYYAIKNWRD